MKSSKASKTKINGVTRAFSPTSVLDLVAARVREVPNAPAVFSAGRYWSYDELWRKSTAAAAALKAQGVGRGDRIGLALERNDELVVMLLAVLLAGAAYVPLDPTYPAVRLHTMVEKAGVKFIIATMPGLPFSSLVLVKDPRVFLDSSAAPDFKSEVKPTDCAYIIFTSGSTGQPKGVVMPHGALLNLIVWQNQTLAAKAKTMQFAPLGFDVSFQEIFSTLAAGGCLYLVPEELRRDPEGLLRFIDSHGLERIFLPFVALQYLAAAAVKDAHFPPSLNEVITAGEQLQVNSHIRRFFTACSAKLINQYGPSETHVATSYTLQGEAASWPDLPPIGKAIANAAVLLLGEDLQPVADGVTGEIYIAGLCLADGYLDAEFTRQRFIAYPGGTDRLYKTGDLARLNKQGDLEFLGRGDGQIKFQGYRIETGEIEVLLDAYPGVEKSAVVLRQRAEGQDFLAAYMASSQVMAVNDLRKYLKEKLPEYMLPQVFMTLATLPLTPSGKVDKAALPPPSRLRPPLAVPYRPPASLVEEQLEVIWRDFLALDAIGVCDSFFDLGGTSVLALKALLAMEEKLGIQLSAAQFFQYPTIAEQAKLVAEEKISFIRNDRQGRFKESPPPEDGIAIVGMAGRFPGANDLNEFWSVIKEGRETVSFFTADELEPEQRQLMDDPNFVPARGVLTDADQFAASFFGFSAGEAEVMDPQQRLFLEACWNALESAGYAPEKFSGLIGVYAGSGNNSYFRHYLSHDKELAKQLGEFPVMVGNEKDYIATRVAHKLNLKGPALSIHTACSTSLVAIAQACQSLLAGQCDLALAGGVAVSAPLQQGHIHQEGGIFSKDGHCRPFDAEATGTYFSDGVGVVVLKRLSAAVADGDQIHAVIKGIGLNNDGAEKASFSAPSSNGQAAAIAMAHAMARVSPEEIGYVEAHGTATPVGDPIEFSGLCQAFAGVKGKHYCALGSLKANMGHLTAAAGVAGLLKTVLILKHRLIPPLANFIKPNPLLNLAESPFYLSNTSHNWISDGKRYAGVSSFGIGGTNCHLLLEEAPVDRGGLAPDVTPALICLSAKNQAALQRLSTAFGKTLTAADDSALADVAYTTQVGRQDFSERRFIIATNKSDARQRLFQPDSMYCAKGSVVVPPRKLVFLFPGQGSQYIGMGSSLYQRQPAFRAAFDLAAGALAKHGASHILPLLLEVSPQAEEVHQTSYTQPSIFAFEYALAKLWQAWGFTPDLLLGHSIGEYVCAVLSGVMTLEEGARLVTARARLMADTPPGAMLAVNVAAADLAKMLPPTLAVAAINGPRHFVVSGGTEEIKVLAALLASKAVSHKILDTSHGFHSPLMDEAATAFAEATTGVVWQKPAIPIISTLTGRLVAAEMSAAEYWVEQIRKPVLYADAVATALAEKGILFLEVGPRRQLTSLLRLQPDLKPEHGVIASGASTYQEEEVAIWQALGRIWLTGFPCQWQLIHQGQPRRRVALPTYPFERTRYWYRSRPPEATAEERAFIQPKQDADARSGGLMTALEDELETISGLDMTTVDASMTFLEMGLDSLLLTQLAINLKNKFKMEITFRQLMEEVYSLDLLAAYLERHGAVGLLEEQKDEVLPPLFAATSKDPHVSLKGFAAEDLQTIFARQLAVIEDQIAMLKGKRPQGNLYDSLLLPSRSEVKPEVEFQQEQPKPFGAMTRISKSTSSLTPRQQAELDGFIKRYVERTKASKAYAEKHRPYMADPRVVTGFKPLYKEMTYPLVVDKSSGAHLWDIDGNQYVDMTCGFGSNFFGYQPDFIKEALANQLARGIELGPQHELAGIVAEKIARLVKLDRVALCNTGSEAVLGALRLARTVTGRMPVVCFSGSYHGINDEVIVTRNKRGASIPAAPGINPDAIGQMTVLDYGSDEALAYLRQHGDEVAALLVEPVQSRHPELRPVEFLKQCRALAQEKGFALIFDEVITGFRSHPGGAQALFGIKADLATYGKVIGGGLPIGVIAGSARFMDALDGGLWQFGDASLPEVGVTYFAGTFIRHPLALAAANAVLDRLLAEGPYLQDQLNKASDALVDELNDLFRCHGAPYFYANFGSQMKLKIADGAPHAELIGYWLRFHGLHIWETFPTFLTTAHSEADTAKIISAFSTCLAEMQDAGFFEGGEAVMQSGAPAPSAGKAKGFPLKKSLTPPLAGARLGRDPQGNPGWYVADPKRPGKFIKIGDGV